MHELINITCNIGSDSACPSDKPGETPEKPGDREGGSLYHDSDLPLTPAQFDALAERLLAVRMGGFWGL
jgi:hypothetical protein